MRAQGWMPVLLQPSRRHPLQRLAHRSQQLHMPWQLRRGRTVPQQPNRSAAAALPPLRLVRKRTSPPSRSSPSRAAQHRRQRRSIRPEARRQQRQRGRTALRALRRRPPEAYRSGCRSSLCRTMGPCCARCGTTAHAAYTRPCKLPAPSRSRRSITSGCAHVGLTGPFHPGIRNDMPPPKVAGQQCNAQNEANKLCTKLSTKLCTNLCTARNVVILSKACCRGLLAPYHKGV